MQNMDSTISSILEILTQTLRRIGYYTNNPRNLFLIGKEYHLQNSVLIQNNKTKDFSMTGQEDHRNLPKASK